MCGIVGYIGTKFADNILIAGLKRLEYRGYDSAGIAVIDDNELSVVKSVGKIAALDDKLRDHPNNGTIGIGHTRWATHGDSSEKNAHPHIDSSNTIAVVHNGIITNYVTLRRELESDGIVFRSDTDTEVLPHLIARAYAARGKMDLPGALRDTVSLLEGAYAFAVVCAEHPDEILCVRQGAPLAIGVGDGEHLIASDASALVAITRDIIYLTDGELAVIRRDSHQILDMAGHTIRRDAVRVDIRAEQMELGDFPHYMLKEIIEQPAALKRIISRYVADSPSGRSIQFNSSTLNADMALENVGRIILIACGTSWHAGLVAKKWFEEIAGVQTEVDIASEFRYRNPIVMGDTLCISISQSGETADTLEGLRKARAAFMNTLSFVNVPQSTIARESDHVVELLAGPEIGVASTKAYTAQLANLYLFALKLAVSKARLAPNALLVKLDALARVPEAIAGALARRDAITQIADRFAASGNVIFLGRGYNVPTAMEAALKLKEISYIHATSYPAGEFKHGPIALIDIQTPTVALMPFDGTFNRMASNVEEVRARKGHVIAVTTDDAPDISHLTDHVLRVPSVSEELTPLVAIAPLQLLAYDIAVLRGCEVDQPRNLAKSVTVE